MHVICFNTNSRTLRITTMSGATPNEGQEKPAEDLLVRSASEAESVMSFESEDLEDIFEKAPNDLFHESPKLGKILDGTAIVNQGLDILKTLYKSTNDHLKVRALVGLCSWR